jgi:allophanate hydrolase subunit 2
MTLVIDRAIGPVTIQDLGRPGHMHEGLAPGGALVPERLIAANRAADNPDDAPALEILGQLRIRAEADTTIATDATLAPGRLLRAGEILSITSESRRVTYLAVRGGFAAPLVLGGRGTQLSAGIGGLLRAGDRLASAGAPPRVAPALDLVDDDGPIGVILGPDAEAVTAGELARLVTQPYRISPASDRTGTRLDGPAIARVPGHVDRSRPMVRGAIELPPDGVPIVLGPEHPTTGGYPAIAVIAHADLGRFFAVRLGGVVRFIALSGDDRR